jgi:hypothetical protein
MMEYGKILNDVAFNYKDLKQELTPPKICTMALGHFYNGVFEKDSVLCKNDFENAVE